jgi:MbtH protein
MIAVTILAVSPTILAMSLQVLRKECAVATNPFEDPDAMYLVLINDEGQHSLWPVFADVPDGWEVIFGEAGRQECLDFIEKNWTDMRPKSLIKTMEADAATRQNGATGQNGATTTKKQNGSRAPKKETVGNK